MSLSPGQSFGRYAIVGVIGQGGMGVVYRAHDEHLDRTVALKILHADAEADTTSETGAARLLREARAAAAIQHPNAAAIYDVGEWDGTAFMAMELVEGRTLRAYVGDARVPVARRMRWLIEVANALAAAHKRGIVHRDVKPENVIVAEDRSAKVLDFGIARRAAGGGPLALSAKDSTVFGSPRYMAPEQLRGEALDGRTDQFAWGILAFELLTGRHPWGDATADADLARCILRRDVPRASVSNALVPDGIDGVIQRAVQKAAADRFGSMDELLVRLRRVDLPADEVDIPTPLGDELSQADRFVRRFGRTLRGITTRTFGMTAKSGAPALLAMSKTARWMAAVAAIVAVVTIALYARRRSVKPAAAPVGAAGATASGGAGAVAASPDFGSTMSANPEAVAAYRAGIQAFRDAAGDRARANLDKAAELDPNFAAAHLRRVLFAFAVDDAARKHAAAASQLRGALGEHDRALLEAFAPWMDMPPNNTETARRMTALFRANPTDPDYAFFLCQSRVNAADYGLAVEACNAAIELDPGLARALQFKGAGLLQLGDPSAASRAYEACLKISPFATSCLHNLNNLEAAEGRCEDAIASSRRLIAIDPESADPYRDLAVALEGAGAPEASVREALDRAWERMPEPEREPDRYKALSGLAILRGDFARATAYVRDWRTALAKSTSDYDHVNLTLWEMDIDLELGRNAMVAREASAYLSQRSAFAPDSDYSVMIRVGQLQAGALARDEFVRERDAWLVKSKEYWTVLSHAPGLDWTLAYALAAKDADAAKEALALLPRYLPLPDPLMRVPFMERARANVYLLAGQPEVALPIVERAVHWCGAFDYPLEPVRTQVTLGKSHEALGDSRKACDAYAEVLRRWGGVRESRSVNEARAARLRLKCSP